MSNKMDLALVEVIQVERFYAELLARMKRSPKNDIDTLKVGISIEGPYLNFNPHFIEQFTTELNPRQNGIGEMGSILKHECEHILRDHPGERRKNIEPDLFNETDRKAKAKAISKLKLINMAEDYEVNQNLPRLPKTFKCYDKEGNVLLDDLTGNPIEFRPCFIDDLIKDYPKIKILTKQTAEYYYKILQQIVDQGGNPTDGPGDTVVATIDNHSGDDATGSLDPETIRQMTAALVNEAYDALSSQEKSNIPANILELIKNINKKSVDWRKQLRQFRTSCSTMEVEETRRRRNRRYGLLYPGRRPKNKLHLVVAIDSSGSVHELALTQFMAEIKAIESSGAKVTVIECDSTIQSVYAYNPKRAISIKGRGGTSFEPVFNLINTSAFIKKYGKPDGLCYFTDGEDYGNLVNKPKCKMLWALLPGCKVRYNWGEQLFIEVDKK